MQKIHKDRAISWYKTMVRIRDFENIIDDNNSAGKLYGTTHLYNGQEAIATAICDLLTPSDLILSTHRNHGHAIAKGTSTYEMFAEIFGKQTGTNGGHGGSMHISDMSVGNVGGNGIVGGNYPVALGLAQALKMDKSEHVVVCFSGDGSTNEGTFHESLNLASIWQLPIIFVVENNQYAMSSDASMMIAGSIAERAKNYDMTAYKVDGQDVFAVHDIFAQARQSVKNGPVLLEAVTYRFKGHSRSDIEQYRTPEEFFNWEDPIKKLRDILIQDYEISEEEIALINEKSYQSLLEQAEKAQGDEDTVSPSDIWKAVYSD
ncbi:thiamine pyrophosphate-dependent dehydrogenase E1 component subunit alpha [Pseudolactococcus plantarum]|uniref:Pyruvate dehydrogenase E1 component alpha subunit n=1 Tax=Pseudolactococcus plantarum TaxID=1365 RepID=A0A2A5RZQ2_9LACT|nr:thiamine pyrophosphate-dependent dehydrogenase E1 component subunit alpha [Lactococcus plantarum]PCS06695.1 Pyruvate dehydrogenase E1 component alpha subunit [Lactococcus plantarum]HCN73965.1 thiamine pyrophosphate-dependent dehydrogenase E1 component subunit alpha [Lactococcus sp.]